MYMMAERQRHRQQWTADGGMDALIKPSLQMDGIRPISHLVHHTSSTYYLHLTSPLSYMISKKVAHMNM